MIKNIKTLVIAILFASACHAEVIVIPIHEDTWIEQGVGDKSLDFEISTRVINQQPSRQGLLRWDGDLSQIGQLNVTAAYIVAHNTAYTATAGGENNVLLCYRLTDRHDWDDTWTFLDFGGMLTVASGDKTSDVAIGDQIITGDANLDGVVDDLDLEIINLNWQGTEQGWIDGDFNFDGIVNAADLNLYATHIGQTAPGFPADVTITDVTHFIDAYAAGAPQNGMQLEPLGGFWRIASNELEFFPPALLYIHVR